MARTKQTARMSTGRRRYVPLAVSENSCNTSQRRSPSMDSEEYTSATSDNSSKKQRTEEAAAVQQVPSASVRDAAADEVRGLTTRVWQRWIQRFVTHVVAQLQDFPLNKHLVITDKDEVAGDETFAEPVLQVCMSRLYKMHVKQCCKTVFLHVAESDWVHFAGQDEG